MGCEAKRGAGAGATQADAPAAQPLPRLVVPLDGEGVGVVPLRRLQPAACCPAVKACGHGLAALVQQHAREEDGEVGEGGEEEAARVRLSSLRVARESPRGEQQGAVEGDRLDGKHAAAARGEGRG